MLPAVRLISEAAELAARRLPGHAHPFPELDRDFVLTEAELRIVRKKLGEGGASGHAAEAVLTIARSTARNRER